MVGCVWLVPQQTPLRWAALKGLARKGLTACRPSLPQALHLISGPAGLRGRANWGKERRKEGRGCGKR